MTDTASQQPVEEPILASPASAVTQRGRYVLLLTILLVGVLLDQATKEVAIAALKDQPMASYLGDLLRIGYAENRGAFLSAGSTLSPETRFWLLVVFNSLMLTAVGIALVWKWSMASLQYLALSCILAGGVGNLIDRVFRGGVVIDFLNLGVGPVRTGVFNVADMAITGGCLVFFWIAFFPARQPKPTEEVSTENPASDITTSQQTAHNS